MLPRVWLNNVFFFFNNYKCSCMSEVCFCFCFIVVINKFVPRIKFIYPTQSCICSIKLHLQILLIYKRKVCCISFIRKYTGPNVWNPAKRNVAIQKKKKKGKLSTNYQVIYIFIFVIWSWYFTIDPTDFVY